MKTDLSIPPLISGGIMLSYRCSNTCRHCLYRCSPQHPNEWMSMAMAERVFTALSQEPQLQAIHIAGGEPFLRVDLLEEVVRLAREMGIPIEYVETNAFWCADPRKTRDTLQRLKDAGLPGILISVSMFHNEFVPFKRTRNCVEAAEEIFGRRVMLYLPQMYQLLSQLPDGEPRSLEEFCEAVGLPAGSRRVPELYHLIPAGRAPDALRAYYDTCPAHQFRHERCKDSLLSTTHFHIDHHGDLFTGLCAGLTPATVDNLHPTVTEQTNPIFCMLCADGPYGLMEMATDEYGYELRDDGYVSKCDLCLHVRTHLQATGEFAELRPAEFYVS